MSDHEKMDIVREIIAWTWCDDKVRHYYIKSFLLGWVSVEQIHELTERNDY